MFGRGHLATIIITGVIGVQATNAADLGHGARPPAGLARLVQAPNPDSTTPPAAPATQAPQEAPKAAPTEEKPPAAAVKVLDRTEAQGVLGREVRSKTDENMGRIVEVIVNRTTGQPLAAIIDFGGFLGVGSRKIAIAWSALQFAGDKASDRIWLDLTRDQVKDAPEYKEGRTIVALTRSGASEPLPDER